MRLGDYLYMYTIYIYNRVSKCSMCVTPHACILVAVNVGFYVQVTTCNYNAANIQAYGVTHIEHLDTRLYMYILYIYK